MRIAAALAALLMTAPLATALWPVDPDDARTGTDAGGHPTRALELAPGRYDADLMHVSGDHADWYHLSGCVGLVATIHPRAPVTLHIQAWSDSGGPVIAATTTGEDLGFGLAGDSYRIGVFDEDGLVIAPYSLKLDDAGPCDAGCACDAPNAHATARDLPLGTYHGLLGFAAGDMEDWYRLVAPPGTTLRVIWRTTDGSAFGGLYREDGSLVANTFSAGENVELTAGPGAYRLGLGDQGGRGGAPYAFTASAS